MVFTGNGGDNPPAIYTHTQLSLTFIRGLCRATFILSNALRRVPLPLVDCNNAIRKNRSERAVNPSNNSIYFFTASDFRLEVISDVEL